MKNPGHLKVLELHFLGKILKRWQYKMNYTNHIEEKFTNQPEKKFRKKISKKKSRKKLENKSSRIVVKTNTSRPTLWTK